MKTVFGFLAAVGAFGVFAFAFGYFDADLADDRRWFGYALIVAAMITAWPAVLRLAEDWPRLKPQHSVELAFLQIGLGLFVLTAAGMLGGRFGAFLEPMVRPTPKLASPGPAGEEPGAAQGAKQPTRSPAAPSAPAKQVAAG